MKRTLIVCLFVPICLILLLSNCKKDDDKIIMQKIAGHVQKGPYINGTSISVFELKSNLEQTGKVFTTQISNNSGSFEVNNLSLNSAFVEFSAEGFYFDEVKGDLSVAPLNLLALSDITDNSTVNVNILTHLEKSRVEYLIKNDKSFSEAKRIAQSEILSIFGFQIAEMSSSESLDISVNNEENAILLAISIILQGNRSVGDLTEILSNISLDIKSDGILDNNIIKANLRNSLIELSLNSIRSNLNSRYLEIGINTTIPNFEKWINKYLEFTGTKPGISAQSVTNIGLTSATLKGTVNPNSKATTVTFQWGSSESYGNEVIATPSPINGSVGIELSTNVTGLLPGKTYHFRIKAENELGTEYGKDFVFTTLGQAPSLTSISTTNIAATSITLNTGVNANYLNTTVTFEFGTSAVYGTSLIANPNPLSGNSLVNVSVDLTGLLKGTTYYARVAATNSLGTTYGNQIIFKTATVQIGESFQGGVVAYILQPGDRGFTEGETHGIIAASTDIGLFQWGCPSISISGADGLAVGTGAQNTLDIVANCAETDCAAKKCSDLELGGFNDWYLPSRDELNKVYISRNLIGGFAALPICVWSSSEEQNGRAWFQDFVSGRQGGDGKTSQGFVRAVRSF